MSAVGERLEVEEDDDALRLAAGTILEGRYRILGELGEGGIGWVYRAEHVKLGHEVAIKMLQPQYAAHNNIRPRFEREAKAMAALSHPHIVTLTDYSVAEGSPYLVMELLQGVTLKDRLDGGPLDEETGRHVARQVLDALAYAHENGFVHRDLKPENIFLCALPTDPHHVKILDFGFVGLVSGANQTPGQPALTQSGIAFGTPSYMSPEQAIGDVTDARSDLYSFGIVLFEMLSGRRPFVGSIPDVVRQHLTDAVPRLSVSGLAGDATPPLRDLLAKATAKAKADRFQSAAEMREALDAIPSPWTTAPIGDAATMMALPAAVARAASASSSRREPSPAPTPVSTTSLELIDDGDRSESSEMGSSGGVLPNSRRKAPNGIEAPSPPSLPSGAAVAPAPPVERPREPPSRSSGLGFGLLVIALLSGGAIWFLSTRPDLVERLGLPSIQAALAPERPASRDVSPTVPATREPTPSAPPDEPSADVPLETEEMSTLLDELSGDWWGYEDEAGTPSELDEEADPTLAEAVEVPALEPTELAVEAEAVAPVDPAEVPAEVPAPTAAEIAPPPAVEPAAVAEGATDDPAAEDPAATEAIEDEAIEDEAAADDAAEAMAEGDDADEDDPLGPNPWRVRPVEPDLVAARRTVLEGRALDRAVTDALRRRVREDRTDPRPHLLIAQSFMAEHQDRLALERYDLAHRVDEGAKGDPRMFFDLVRLAIEGDVRAQATTALDRIYGEDGVALLAAILEEDELPAEHAQALRALHDRLEAAGEAVPARPRARASRNRPRARRARPRANRRTASAARQRRARMRRLRAQRLRRARARRRRR